MAQFDLYVDIAGGYLVKGTLSNDAGTTPAIVQGDSPTWRVWLLQRVPTWPIASGGAAYTIVDISALSLEVAVGLKIGDDTTYYATQFAWNRDAANQYFYAAISFNTTDITDLLDDGSTAPATLEIKVFSGGVPATVLQLPVTVQAAVIKVGAPEPQPNVNWLTKEVADATYLGRQVAGAIILVAPDGSKVAIYADNGGKFKADKA